MYFVHQVVEFGAGEGEGENKEEEKGKDPVLEAQQIAKRILGYNSSDPGRLQPVFLRIEKYQQHFPIRHLSSVPEPDADPYDFGPAGSGSVIMCTAPVPDHFINKQKIKKIDFYIFVILNDLLSFRTDVMYLLTL